MNNFDLTNSANWSLIHSQSYNARIITTSPLRFDPIPLIDLPIVSNGKLLSVYCECNHASVTWQYGGQCLINTNFTPVVGNQRLEIYRQSLYLDRYTLIDLSSYINTYSISIQPPYWFRQLTISIFEYNQQ